MRYRAGCRAVIRRWRNAASAWSGVFFICFTWVVPLLVVRALLKKCQIIFIFPAMNVFSQPKQFRASNDGLWELSLLSPVVQGPKRQRRVAVVAHGLITGKERWL